MINPGTNLRTNIVSWNSDIPAHPNFLPRTDLAKKLDDLRDRPLRFVVAPPGFGKTAFVANYVSTEGYFPLWYRLDKSHHELRKIFIAFHAQARKFPGIDLSSVNFDQVIEEDLGKTLLTFLSVVQFQTGRNVLLVFDDYRQSEVTEVLDGWMQEFAGQWRGDNAGILILSKERPVSGWMRPASLKLYHTFYDLEEGFSEVEAVQLADFYRKKGLQISDEEMFADFLVSMRVWPACLLIALEYAIKAEFISFTDLRESTREAVFSHFLNQFLLDLPEEIQRLLVKASLCPVMNSSILDQFLGDKNRKKLTAGLKSYRVFVETRSEISAHGVETEYLSFHDLLNKFLRSKVEKYFSEQEITGFYHQLAQIYRYSAGSYAIKFAKLAGDRKLVGDIVKDSMEYFLSPRWYEILSEYYEELTFEAEPEDPVLLVFEGMKTSSTDTFEAEKVYERAFQKLLAMEDSNGLAACIHWILTLGNIRGLREMHLCDRWVEMATTECPFERRQLKSELRFVFEMILFRIFTKRVLNWEEFERCRSRCMRLLHTAPSREHRMAMLIALIISQVTVEGDGDELELLLRMQESLDWQNDSGISYVVVAYKQYVDIFRALLFEADIDFASAELSKLMTYIEEHFDICHNQCQEVINLCFWLALLKADENQCRHWLERAQHFGFECGHDNGDLFRLDFYHWTMARLRRDIASQKKFAKKLAVQGHSVGGTESIVYGYWANAVTAMEKGRRRLAWQQLAGLRHYARFFHSELFSALERLTGALICLDSGREKRAVSLLIGGLEILKRNGLRLVYPLHRSDWQLLCGLAFSASVEIEYVSDIVRALRLPPPEDSLLRLAWPWPVKINILDGRQLVVQGKELPDNSMSQREYHLIFSLAEAGPTGLTRKKILNRLWGKETPTKGALRTVVYRARKILKNADALVTEGGYLRLNQQHCMVDQWAFLQLIDNPALATQAELEAALAMYSKRDTFDTIALQCESVVKELGERYEINRDWQGAIAIYMWGVENIPSAETAYCGLMRCYAALNHPGRVEEWFLCCKQALDREVGAGVSIETIELYLRLSNASMN